MAEQNTTSPWVWVAVGCGSVVVLAVLGLVTLGFLGFRWAKKLERTMEDPVARAEATRRILNCERLPDGYHAMVGFSVPLLMELAVLSDREIHDHGEPQGFDERGFIYIKMISLGRQSQELRDYFDGKTDDASVLRQNNIRVRTDEVIRRGVIEQEDRTLMYLVQRGSLDMYGGQHDGLTNIMLIRCPGDAKTRLGIWFGPDPAGGVETSDSDMTGTPADEAAIREFTGHFGFCG